MPALSTLIGSNLFHAGMDAPRSVRRDRIIDDPEQGGGCCRTNHYSLSRKAEQKCVRLRCVLGYVPVVVSRNEQRLSGWCQLRQNRRFVWELSNVGG